MNLFPSDFHFTVKRRIHRKGVVFTQDVFLIILVVAILEAALVLLFHYREWPEWLRLVVSAAITVTLITFPLRFLRKLRYERPIKAALLAQLEGYDEVKLEGKYRFVAKASRGLMAKGHFREVRPIDNVIKIEPEKGYVTEEYYAYSVHRTSGALY
jgi:hypothetical protein